MTSSNIGTPQSVVFIDSNVPDLQDLLNGLAPGVEAFVIDPSNDGLAQIAAMLASNDLTNLSSISIVGHGVAGQIQVGSTTLDAGDLSGDSTALAQIGAALAPGGAFQLYACDVASGSAGQQFIAELSQYAGGATVAASAEDIGTLQGTNGLFENWTLDDSAGTAAINAPFTSSAMANYEGLLAGTTVKASTVATTLKTDADGDQGISPGDTVTSSVTITNTTSTAATGVTFSETLSGLTANSVLITPIAVNDSYSATGNAPLTLNAASGVLANDTEFNGGTLTAISATNATNGAVTLNADGSFTFTPTTGFSGTASFQYTADDAAGNSVDKATVTIAVGPPTWYVNSGASGTQDGTAAHPFATIQQAISAAAADTDHGVGDTINIAAGSYSGADISLASGEKLIGAGSGSTTFTVSSGTAITLGDNNTISGITISNTGSGDGIDDSSSSTGTTTMSNIVVTTGSGTGISFTHGGTVDITGTANTVSSSTGTALNVTNTTIGTSGITFKSISSGTGGSASNDGIILDNTGSSGGLTITGDGSTAGSGGTIEDKTGTTGGVTNGVGIYLNNTADVSLAYMQLNGLSYDGIYGQSVTNFSMDHTTVNGANGSAVGEGSVVFGSGVYAGQSTETGITGAGVITNSTISGGYYDNLDIFTSPADITLDHDTFGDNNATTGNHNVYIDSNSDVTNATVTNSSFTGVAAGDNFFYNSSDGDVATDVTFDSNTVTDNLGGAGGDTGSGPVQLQGGTHGTSTFDVENNNISGSTGSALVITKNIENNTGSGDANAVLDLIVNHNTVSTPGAGADAINILQEDSAQTNANAGTLDATITNNTVTEWDNLGIDLETGGGSAGGSTGTFEAQITGNVETNSSPDTTTPAQGIGMNDSNVATDDYTVYLTIGGTSAAKKNNILLDAASQDIRLRPRSQGTIFLTADDASGNPTVSYTGGATDGTAVATFLEANNTTTNDGTGIENNGKFGGTAPPDAPPPGATFSTPSISDNNHSIASATEGDTLTASLVGASATYQWQESFSGIEYVDISSATSSTYTLKESDVGATLRVVETSTYSDGQTDTADSGATGAVADNLTLSTPTISGNATVGQILTASTPTTDNPDATITYQWKENFGSGFVNISGATGQTYRLASTDANADIEVVAIATDPHGGDVTSTPSASTGPVNAFTDPSLSNVSIGTLPGNDAVTVSWQATVDPQSDQLIVNPTYTGSVTGSDFTTVTADGTVPLDTLSLEGEIFNDANGDGTLDGVDAGISGVSLSVFVQGSSTALESTTTNGGGVYDFTGLAAGNYYVQINALPSGYGNSSPVRDTTPNDYAGGKNYGLAASGGVIDTNAITIAYDQPEPSSNGSTYPGDDTTSTLDIGLVQAPQIGGTGITVQYYQGGAAKPLDSNLTLTDSVNVSGATVTIGNFLTGDTLNFTTQNSISEQSYTGGVLTLTGNATAAQYQTALDSITYSFSGDPTNAGADTTRTITWSVSDTNSQTSVGGSTSTLDVYMTPVLAGIVSPTPTVTATSGAVAADSSLTITDDNTIGTTPVATVTITSGSQAGDELIIPDGDLTTGKITGTTITVSNNDTTALTLTGTSTTTDAQFQSALRDVEFDATSPHSGPRQLTWSFNDDAGGNTNDSNSFMTNVNATFGPDLTGGQNFGETEGTSTGPLQLVTFTDSEITSPTIGNFTAAIDWGDGTALDTTGTIVSKGGGVFAVDSAGHTYAEAQAAPYQIAVTVTDTDSVSGTATDNAQVTDAALTGSSAASLSGIEGASAALSNATFTDANPGDHTGDFTATIDWGDGGPSSSGTVSYSAGIYSVAGSHTYAEEGSDNIAVTVTDDGGSNTTITGAASITDAALTGSSAASLSGIEGASAALSNATFTDANPGDHTGDFTATINWGDGGPSSPGTISYSGGVYSVAGSHTYAEEGSDNVTVTVTDDGGSNTTITGTASITDAALTGSSAASMSGIEGASAALSNATFTDANPGDHTGDFTATIDWGDGGQSSPGTVSYSGGVYSVAGSHTYAEEGSDNITVTVTDDGGSSTTITGTASITDAALTGSGVTENGTQDVSLTAPVATFTDANPNGSVSDFTATVTWGDGTAATSATITESGGVFTVAGTHTYAIQGTYMPTVTIVDDGGSTATVTDTFDIVHAPPTMTAGGNATYIGAGAVTLDAGVTVSDPDSGGDLAGATVTISTGFIAGDTLEIGGQTSGTITDTGGTINYAFTGSTLSLSGSDTLADYQAALDAVTYSFSPSNGDATNGGTDTSRTISWTVNDGAPSNGTGTAASTLLVPTTPVVTAVAASVNASASESFTAAQLFSASDAAGAPILTYQVEDESGGSSQGFWVLNGAVLPNGQITTLTAAQLFELSFVAGSASTPVSDTLEVAASDAAGLGAFTTFTVTAAAHAPTTAPTVTAANELQAPNLALAGSSLFSGTAFGGNTITSYEVEDITTDSGHWVFNGTVEPTNQVIDVTVAQLAQLSFDTGYGSDTLMVRANDGTQWGSFTSFTVTPPPNAAPPAGSTDTLMMLRNSDGAYEFYDIGRNTILLDGPLGQINPVLQVAGVGGFNGSDTADLLMRDPTTGVFTLYDVSNNNITGNVVVGQVGLEWTVSGFGDFSTRAGETDMLMRNSNTGQFEVYDIANNAITFAGPMGQVGLEWSIAGFGDFSTRANETDMLMRNSNTGAFEVYDIVNNTITSFAPMGQVGLEWTIAGFGDFSTRANETDMLMRNSNTGAFEVYDISNNAITSFAPMGQVGLEWTIAGFGDFSGNANETDMLMRNSNTGAFELFDISKNTITSAEPMGQVGLEWSVAGIAAYTSAGSSPANAQLAQAMASFAPSAAPPAANGPIAAATQVSPASPLIAAPHPS
ncbi:MAG TPA: DUF4347 domain-containing protein [Xanthobacteraceae bacterium]